MNNEHNKNNDPIQLQQTIIYLKAELAKYIEQVEKYEDTSDYLLIERLEQEIYQLTNDKEELTFQLDRLRHEMEQHLYDYKDRIQSHEVQRKTYLTSINHLQKTIDDLRQMNNQLNEVTKVLKDELNKNENMNQLNKIIGSLQQELLKLKEQNERFKKDVPSIDAETLMQLDQQIKKLLGQSFDYEIKLNSKFIVLNELEHKLDQLITEMTNIKSS